MGVTGLWTVVQPCARPIKLETLNRKRLAVDASIWIYQFLKAVRDKEGNALRNSHVVGFFRRICKLLFFGIKPVFVFDGGAPILKRQTISGRKARREGRRDDAVRTAGKLLAVQMQRRAEDDERKRKEDMERPRHEEEEEIPDNLVYVDELQMTKQERQQNRAFRKKDAYHLPSLDVDLTDMGAPNDPRIMSHEELEEYARQFHTGEDVNVYDFNKIDFESPFFQSLPATDRYNILNAARLRSRLRMGYSKEQLDTMFPNRMDFSRFQIDRVKERNELTQRLMNINGMNGDVMAGINDGGRVAGEKGKEYVLVKNDGVEGGWALGVVSNKNEGDRNKPIDVENLDSRDMEEDGEEEWEDDGFEDVPIEGLNRLPRRHANPVEQLASEQRQKLYESRTAASNAKRLEDEAGDPDSLFIDQNPASNDDVDEMDDLFEDVQPPEDEDEELNKAIALSLEGQENDSETELPSFAESAKSGPRIDRPLEFNEKNAKAGRDFAHLTNARAHGSAPQPFNDDSDEEDRVNVQEALRESRDSMHRSGPRVHGFRRPDKPSSISKSDGPGFSGPLPFESLDLGKSILGQKKKKPAEVEAGGFEKEKEENRPLPPWFSGDIREATAKQKAIEEKQSEGAKREEHNVESRQILRRQETDEVIDLDAPTKADPEIIAVDEGEKETDPEVIALDEVESEKHGRSDEDPELETGMAEAMPIDSEVRMDDLADLARVEPPVPNDEPNRREASLGETTTPQPADDASDQPIDWSESEPEDDRRTNVQDVHLSEIDNVESAQEMPESTKPDNQAPSMPHEPSTDGFLAEAYQEADEEYSDPEEEELMRQMAIEAEEHARFAAELNSKSQLQSAEDYEKELRQLRNQQKKDRRDADEVTHIMVTECQQLLRLFGLPYITAPMEAEAQCAEMVTLGLVDGIVTDDSDIFLFGGTRIYKNMFNQSKFVESYLASDLEKEYGLDRQKLIRFAHLLGSDYTEGLPSVGPVTALEILSEFETLELFSEWWNTVQLGQPLSAADASNPFRRKFRKNASKLFLPTTFPDTRVDYAYLNPEVDSDPQPFQWGVPDLDSLRQYLMATIGWSQERTDEVLVPVIKDMNRREDEGTQANITRFFSGGVGLGGRAANGQSFAPRRKAEGKSRRMETALGRLQSKAKDRHTNGEQVGTRGGKRSAPEDEDEDDTPSESAEEPPRKSTKYTKSRRSRTVK